MPSGHCPVCAAAGRKSLHEIVPTPEPIDPRNPDKGSARRWKLVMHSDGNGELCAGSDARI